MAKVKLITEFFDKAEIKEKNGEVFVEGVFASANLKNKNGRTYKKNTLEREVTKLQESVDRKALWLELGHPSSPDVNLDRVAALMEKLEWKGDNLMGRAKLLDTPMGKVAKALVKEGTIGVSSRGLGTVNEDGTVNDELYQMVTFDLVSNPSNHPSWVKGVYEGATFESTQNVDEDDDEELDESKKVQLTKDLILELKKLF